MVLHSEGAMKSTSPKKLEQLLASHGTVILLDIAGTGTAANTGEGIFYGRFGAEAKDAVILDLLGESLVGYQAQQILGAIRALGGNQPVDLDVTGRVGVAAHHAAGLEPGLFRGVRIQGCISSWEELMQRHDIELYFSHVVLNALKEYDLPDLARVFNGAAR